MLRKILLTASLLLVFSCQEKRPDDVLDRDTYKQVLKDIILSDIVKNELKRTDTIPVKTLAMVYAKYNIDSTSFKKTTDYYSRHPKVFVDIYKEIKDAFQQKVDSLEKANPGVKNDKPVKKAKITLPESILNMKKKIKGQD